MPPARPGLQAVARAGVLPQCRAGPGAECGSAPAAVFQPQAFSMGVPVVRINEERKRVEMMFGSRRFEVSLKYWLRFYRLAAARLPVECSRPLDDCSMIKATTPLFCAVDAKRRAYVCSAPAVYFKEACYGRGRVLELPGTELWCMELEQDRMLAAYGAYPELSVRLLHYDEVGSGDAGAAAGVLEEVSGVDVWRMEVRAAHGYLPHTIFALYTRWGVTYRYGDVKTDSFAKLRELAVEDMRKKNLDGRIVDAVVEFLLT